MGAHDHSARRAAMPRPPQPRAPPPLLSALQGVVTAATGAGITMVLRRALTNTSISGGNLGQVRPSPPCMSSGERGGAAGARFWR